MDFPVAARKAPEARILGEEMASRSGREREERPGSGRQPAAPRKLPQQERSRALVAAVRDACLRILDEEGAPALTTNRIAQVAGVGIGSIYQYFPNKEAIVAGVYEEVIEAELCAMREWGERLDRLSVEDAIRLMIEKAVERENRLMKLDREFYRRYHRSFDLTTRWSRDAHDPAIAVDALAQLFERERHKLRVQDPRLAAFLIARGMRAIIWLTLEENPKYISDPAFVDGLVDLSLGCLLTEEIS
jgi:AcrR family transcriptional regulator